MIIFCVIKFADKEAGRKLREQKLSNKFFGKERTI